MLTRRGGPAMNLSISMLLGLAAATLLLAQGAATLRQLNLTPQDMWLSWLAILIASLGLTAQILLYSGALVITPRFGNMIVQGYPALVVLTAMMVGITVSAGIWLDIVRVRVGWRKHQWRWIILGALFGLSTLLQISRLLAPVDQPSAEIGTPLQRAFQVVAINSFDPTPLHIFAYDLRWPLLLAWLSYCVVESLLALLLFARQGNSELCDKDEYRDLRAWVGSLALAIQGVWALNQPVVSPQSLLLWELIVVAAVTYNTVKTIGPLVSQVTQPIATKVGQVSAIQRAMSYTATHVQMPAAGTRQRAAIRWMFISLLGLIYIRICLLLLSWTDASPRWRGIVIIIGLIVLWSWLPLKRRAWLRQALLDQQPTAGQDVGRERWAAIPLLAIALSLIGLFYDFYGMGPAIPLACFFIACVAFNDIVVECGLRHQLLASAEQGRIRQLLAERSGFRVRLGRAPGVLGGIAKSLTTWFNQLLNLRTAPIALVKLLIVIIMLLGVSELANAGKTIVQPFGLSGLADPSGKAEVSESNGLGQAISDRLVSSLGRLGQKLQPDAIILSPGVRGGVKIQFINTDPHASSVDAVLAQNNELDIGGVKAPLGLFVTPVREPVRLALNVRTISGRILDDGDSYTLLASSNKGETWISKYPHHDLSQAVISGTEELAFDIVSADPAVATLGMTHSWQAFQLFLHGLEDWKAFEDTKDAARLNSAITQFQKATDADHVFALAFYRLGIAHQQNNEPESAIAAFRSSIAADPKFVPAYNALAYALYNFAEYDGNAKSALLPLAAASGEQARTDEARRHWQQIMLFGPDTVTPYDRASAYYGLCLDASDQNLYPLAYFYCQRAEAMYSKLSTSMRADLRVKQAEAAVLNTLGVAVMRLRLPQIATEEPNGASEVPHSCLAVELTDGGTEARPLLAAAPWALRYFEQALSLQPDDPNIRCNLAGADKLLGNDERAKALNADAGTLRSLADSYRILAKKYFFLSLASDNLTDAADQKKVEAKYRNNANSQRATALAYYHMALEGYQKAIDHDPLDTQALLGYAYTIWQWRFEQLHYIPIEGPPPQAAQKGVNYARRAAALADASGSSAGKALAHARLGAVLLGQMEPKDAVRELLRARREMSASDLAYNETTWMLAQAYLCSANTDVQARQLLDEIASNTQAHDLTSFTESRFLDTQLPGSDHNHPILRCTLGGA